MQPVLQPHHLFHDPATGLSSLQPLAPHALDAGVEGRPTCQHAMILCPSSLVTNWGKELIKWIGEGRVDPVTLEDTKGAVR